MYADLHCDTFYKCFADGLFFDDNSLHVNVEKSKDFSRYIQTFAHYIPEKTKDKFGYFQKMLENSYRIIGQNPKLHLMKSYSDVELAEKQNKILVILSVEGGDFFDKDIVSRMDFLEKNHIRFISLCYNNGNDMCCGAFSKKDNGFTKHGLDIAYMLSERGMALDLSHLSCKSASDAVNNNLNCIATHSNCKSVLDHPRNLEDDTILKLIEKGSLIGLNLYKDFVGKTISDHISHIVSLGGLENLAFGADFDGCDIFSDGVESLSDMNNFLSNLSVDKQLFYNNVKKYLKLNIKG